MSFMDFRPHEKANLAVQAFDDAIRLETRTFVQNLKLIASVLSVTVVAGAVGLAYAVKSLIEN